jgi:hypothetical protein
LLRAGRKWREHQHADPIHPPGRLGPGDEGRGEEARPGEDEDVPPRPRGIR